MDAVQSGYIAGAQGGILFWLRGNLRDWPGISPEIALIKNKNNERNLYKAYIF